MKPIQIGSAVFAPSSLSPRGRSWSKPTHTVTTRLRVKPLNQVSLASLVVPVLPARSVRPERHRAVAGAALDHVHHHIGHEVVVLRADDTLGKSRRREIARPGALEV